MNSLNSVLIEGALVADPEIFREGRRLTFAVQFHRFFNRDGEKQKEVGEVFVELFGKLAEESQGRLSKGKGVRIVGRLKQCGTVQGSADGVDVVPLVKIVGENVEFKRSFDGK